VPLAALLYGAAYAGSLAVLSTQPGFDAGEALAVLVVFGLGYSAAAWWATRAAMPAACEVRVPGRELALVLGYLVFFAVAVLGWGLSAVRAAVPDGRLEETALLFAKLLTMVAVPAWLFGRGRFVGGAGYRWGDLAGTLRLAPGHRRAFAVMAALFLLLQLTIGRGPAAISALPHPWWVVALAAPAALVWMTLEAGLTEEFLFRGLLQSRASAWLRSEVAGIVVMALLFGLAHAPGYVLRGAHVMEGMAGPPGAITAAAYAVAVVSPIGLVFGVLWARTRSLPLVVLLHGWADLVPNLAPFVRTWFA
jgi:membrane protease YdiL (CAAX protease family)